MGTKVLSDIHNDLKLLITAITTFKEDEEGFRICERFVLSNIKHHRYLSVNGHETRDTVDKIGKKFSIHGKYEVAKTFTELVHTFLTSFDFDHHPQYDLQWSLLTLLLDLSSETNKASLESLAISLGDPNITSGLHKPEDSIEEIDWADYLKEGQEDFFCDFKSDSESSWSDVEDESAELSVCTQASTKDTLDSPQGISIKSDQGIVDTFSGILAKGIESRNWLLLNVQNSWWNDVQSYKYPIISKFASADFCNIWHKATGEDFQNVSTLSEYQACRELLWMFHIQKQMIIFQQEKDSVFTVSSNISLPSVTPVAFKSFLSPYCEYLTMLERLNQFSAELYARRNGSKAPLTYEAYNAALKQHLQKFREDIIDIERSLIRQDTSNTLLTLSESLRKHLNIIKILYEVHKAVIMNWQNNPNWRCASTLLSGLYFEMEKSPSYERTNICAHLYLSSIAVYLNIVDTWLSEGRLEDWRDEFIIVRLPKETSIEGKQCETCKIRDLDNICVLDPIMQFLLRKIQHMGHNIELLDSLDRVSDIWKIMMENDGTRTSLNDEFNIKLRSEISKYICADVIEKVDLTESEYMTTPETEIEIENVSNEMYSMNLEQNIIQQLSGLDNPFLMKAFQDYIPPDLCKNIVSKKDSQDHSIVDQEDSLFESLQNTQGYILPLKNILQSTLSETLDSRYNSASKLVKNIMTEEYQLEVHLKLMRSIYMMEAGHIMNKFNQSLFREIESNRMWNNSYFLSCILEEVLSQEWPDSSSRWSIKVDDTETNEVLRAVNDITLNYTIGWPISIVLNEKAFSKYNEIFRFQLKLKWALWTLHNLKFHDLEDSKTMYTKEELEAFLVRRLENLRFWLLHAIGSIHAYLSGQVLQNLGFILERALTQADSLDTIISVHNEYLIKAHEHCLLTTAYEDLMTTINSLIEMCLHVRKRWTRSKLLFAATELDVMEQSYIKYHTYLALALHSAVQHKDADYYKLMSKRHIDNERSIATTVFMTDLCRNLLAEIAFQSLPPSGIPIQIPRMIHGNNWRVTNSVPSLPDELLLNEYEQIFSYIRWYQYEEASLMQNSSMCISFHEMGNIIKKLFN